MILMTSLFDDFLNDFARRQKHRTAMTYHKLLSLFEKWLDETGKVSFDREDVLEFLDQKSWSNATRNCALAALRGWARFARGYAEDGHEQARLSRIEGIKDYTVKREEKPALSLAQISNLFSVMDPDTSTIFWILLWFGFRLHELKLIKSMDDHGRLVVETEKRGGTRTLFFDSYTERLLKIAKDKKLLDLPDIKIWKMLRKYSGIVAPARLTPHLARHAFASHFAELTDRDTLRRMLGHGPRETTDIYVHVSEERIREVMIERHYMRVLEPTEV